MLRVNCEEGTGAACRVVSAKHILVVVLSFLFISLRAQAQPCLVPILGISNTFEIKPATCVNTVAFLQGSQPLGGNGTYTYQWQKNTANCNNSGFSDISGATAKDYAVPSSDPVGTCYRRIVKSGSCTDTSDGERVNANDRTTPPAPAIAVVQPTCTSPSGRITVTSPAPSAVLGYSINGTNYTNPTGIFTGVAPGTYSVTVQYPSGCISPAATAIINPLSGPTGTVSPASAVICPGNFQTLTVTTTPGAQYQWKRNGVDIPGANAPTHTTDSAGTYTVAITVGSCTGQSANAAVVTMSLLPTGTITPSSATICPGGLQVLQASGGVRYQWFKDNVLVKDSVNSVFRATEAGVYTVDIFNANGCKARATNSVTITVAPLPTGSIIPATVSICTGDSVTLTATGGTNYLWYKDGSSLTTEVGATFKAKEAGRYVVDVFDANNCRGRSLNESIVTVIPTPTGTISPANAVLCPNDSVVLKVAGGTTYQWYNGTSLIAGQTKDSLVVKGTGSYSVEIFTVGNCKGRSTNTVTVTAGTLPTGTISPATATLCTGNTVQLSVVNSTGSRYQWYLNNGPLAGETAATLTARATGNYTVRIFNTSCNALASNTVVVSPSPAINFTATPISPSCTVAAGTITVNTPTGGSGSGYSYSINGGANFQPSNTFSGLAPGTYQVVVKDGAGCQSVIQTLVIAPFTSTLQATATATTVTCTQPTGTATITATGGTPSYTYSLNGGTPQTSNVFPGLPAGTHKVLVKDAQGCTFEVTFTVTQINSTLGGTVLITNASCGQANGGVVIQATGGIAPYSYSLNSGTFVPSNTFGGLAVGSHRATIRDNAGCLFNINFAVSQPIGNPNLVITNPPRLCKGDSANLRAASVTAGSDANLTLTYWSDAAATVSLANPNKVLAGTYYIKATNSGGCVTVKPVVVTLHTPAATNVFATRFTACVGDTISLTASLGASYQWYRNDSLLTGATGIVYQATVSGLYKASVNDGTCASQTVNTIRLQFDFCLPDTRVFVPTAFTPNRNGANDVLRPIFYHVSRLAYFRVYNRWGQQVFETNVIGRGWDGTLNGTPQPAETYSWILECTGKNGEVIKQSGRSLLIR